MNVFVLFIKMLKDQIDPIQLINYKKNQHEKYNIFD